MIAPTMKILYGPPGTGKTWRAAREAVKAIEPSQYLDALAKSEDAIRDLHNKLVDDGRILWVTFHPGYSYEDFVEGYRPITDDLGQLTYRVVDGPFKSLCHRAKFENDLQIGDKLVDGSGKQAGTVVDKDAGGWVIRVTPNRSDEVAVSVDKYVPRYVINKILAGGFSSKIFSIPGKGDFELSDYGLSPDDPDVGEPKQGETRDKRSGSVIRKIIAARTGIFSSSDLSNSSHFGSVVRKMVELRASAHASKGATVALVIDEVNRAEPSRVFGELLTLIETDKRQDMPEEKKIWLPYSKVLFSVPIGVSIIGTMNTVDRSLTALDFAIRRRFEFELVSPEADLTPVSYGGINVKDFLHRINSRISSLLGTGYEFGHAAFMLSKLNEVMFRQGWKEMSDGELRAFAYTIRSTLLPTLAEYFHDDIKKLKAIVGDTRSGSELISLFKKSIVDEMFFERLSDEYEVSEHLGETYADWWNPKQDTWNAEKFRRFTLALSEGH